MAYNKQEREAAKERLREILRPGDTVWTCLRHVSRSGMMRGIDVYKIEDNTLRWLTPLVAEAVGVSIDAKREYLKVSGCGMDMGFWLVYELSAALFGNGFGCIGEGCPSNDHSNGDRDYTPHRVTEHAGDMLDIRHDHWHKDGGYALLHRWI